MPRSRDRCSSSRSSRSLARSLRLLYPRSFLARSFLTHFALVVVVSAMSGLVTLLTASLSPTADSNSDAASTGSTRARLCASVTDVEEDATAMMAPSRWRG